jgi:hypothetical protein
MITRTGNPALTLMSPVFRAILWVVALTLPADERRSAQAACRR